MDAHWFDQFCEIKVHLYLYSPSRRYLPLRMCVEKFPESCHESLELLLAFDFFVPHTGIGCCCCSRSKG